MDRKGNRVTFLTPCWSFCTGISFVPKEIGEHFVNIKKNGRHIPNSPIAVMINQSEIGDASRVRVSGPGLSEARTFEPAEFIIDTRDAGTGLIQYATCGFILLDSTWALKAESYFLHL